MLAGIQIMKMVNNYINAIAWDFGTYRIVRWVIL